MWQTWDVVTMAGEWRPERTISACSGSIWKGSSRTWVDSRWEMNPVQAVLGTHDWTLAHLGQRWDRMSSMQLKQCWIWQKGAPSLPHIPIPFQIAWLYTTPQFCMVQDSIHSCWSPTVGWHDVLLRFGGTLTTKIQDFMFLRGRDRKRLLSFYLILPFQDLLSIYISCKLLASFCEMSNNENV